MPEKTLFCLKVRVDPGTGFTVATSTFPSRKRTEVFEFTHLQVPGRRSAESDSAMGFVVVVGAFFVVAVGFVLAAFDGAGAATTSTPIPSAASNRAASRRRERLGLRRLFMERA